MDRDSVIYVNRLRKVYPQDLTVGKIFSYLWRRSKGRDALHNITFSVPRGQVLGLIGANGAGKSTLLRIIADQSEPTEGVVKVSGHLLAMLEIATGLRDEWSGRENIRFLGPIYGMSEKQIQERTESIIAFSQLENFIDFPVRTYSAGMRARLAFSLVTSVDCDILLIDEALSVGDAGFALRCRERIRALCNKGLTVIIVSHSMLAIRELCDRVLWLDSGLIMADGKPERIIEEYRIAMLTKVEKDFERKYFGRSRHKSLKADTLIEDLYLQSYGRRAVIVSGGSAYTIHVIISCANEITSVEGFLEYLRVDGVLIMRSRMPKVDLRIGKNEIRIDFQAMRLGRFAYECRFVLLDNLKNVLAERSIVVGVEDDYHSYNSTYYQPIEWGGDTSLI